MHAYAFVAVRSRLTMTALVQLILGKIYFFSFYKNGYCDKSKIRRLNLTCSRYLTKFEQKTDYAC